MTRATICVQRGLVHEGGYVNHPNDAGGPTNLGITLAVFRRHIKSGGTIDDLKELTKAQATVVYKRQYWDPCNADMLPIGVDYALYDYAINSGVKRAVKALQQVVGAVQDGKVGPATIGAVKTRDAREVVRALCDQRIAFMKRAKNRNTGKLLWPDFGRGWQRRVDEVRELAALDILEAPVVVTAADNWLTRLLKALLGKLGG